MKDQLSNEILQFLKLDTTRQFLAAAEKFVYLLEDKSIARDEFLRCSHNALIDLYYSGQKLQEIKLNYSSADRDFDRDVLFDNNNAGLISELAEQTFYWEIFDPTYLETDGTPERGWKISDKEASQGWLVDDFADIYRDLKIELQKIITIGTNEAVEDALWQLKFSFRHHWGEHAINALRYLHYYSYEGKL